MNLKELMQEHREEKATIREVNKLINQLRNCVRLCPGNDFYKGLLGVSLEYLEVKEINISILEDLIEEVKEDERRK